MDIEEIDFDERIELWAHPDLGVLLARYEGDNDAVDMHYILQVIDAFPGVEGEENE